MTTQTTHQTPAPTGKKPRSNAGMYVCVTFVDDDGKRCLKGSIAEAGKILAGPFDMADILESPELMEQFPIAALEQFRIHLDRKEADYARR